MRADTYFNGRIGSRREIAVPLSDRAIYFGDAVYDAAIGRNGAVFLLAEHVDRLYRSAERIDLHPRIGKTALCRILCEMTKGWEEPFFLYFQFSRSETGARAHTYSEEAGCHLLILIDRMPPPCRNAPISLITAEDLRYAYCDIKTVNLLPAVLASKRAERAKAEEAVLHRGAKVTECAHSNIAILKDGVLYTHPLGPRILDGISRRHLLSAARAADIPVKERAFTLSELWGADEILVTSASKICRRARLLNGKSVAMRDEGLASILCNAMFDEWERATAASEGTSAEEEKPKG